MERPTFDQQLERINKSLTNITPLEPTIEKIEQVRIDAKILARRILVNVPDSRERSLAITHLEETVMWAVKGLVVNQADPTDG